MIGLNCLKPGQIQKPHVHDDQDKFYYVVEGEGRFWLGQEQVLVASGEVVWTPAGQRHGVENEGDGRRIHSGRGQTSVVESGAGRDGVS